LFSTARRGMWRLASLGVVSFIGLVALPTVAQAGIVSLGHCDNSQLTQPFTQWGDSDYYKLAPGGDFENSLTGWSLRGGASATSGSESFGVTGDVGQASLSLPAGATATSPATCVNAAYPSFRVFSRSHDLGGTVAVSVVYPSALGNVTLPVGVVTPTGSWQPSAPLLTGSAIPGALGGGTANVQLQFTAVGGDAEIDDVFVDPWGRCC
jgi:hypothetical protein